MSRQIPTSNGQVVIVDDEDYDWSMALAPWYATPSGYAINTSGAAVREFGTRLMHRMLLDAKKGVPIDHINGNGLDNRRENLRFVTPAQNHMNRHIPKRGSTSKYKGVYWGKKHKKWVARIGIDGKTFHLGNLDSEEDAALLYDAAARLLFREFSCPNFPEMASSQHLIDLASRRLQGEKTRVCSSSFVGVHWQKEERKWISSIRIGGKKVCLGRFTSEEEAAKVYTLAKERRDSTKCP